MPKADLAIATPSLLQWAREAAGFDLESAASRAKVRLDSLAAWETGAAQPSVPQLRKLARLYKRPFAAFFLEIPPEKIAEPHDFRRMPRSRARPFSPELLVEWRRILRRRDLALELMAEIGTAPTSFDFRISVGQNADAAAASIRSTLGVSVETQFSWSDAYEALTEWSAAIEAREVLVFHMTGVDVSEARGVSFPAAHLPVIAANSGDHPHARVFTLLHEFAHLALRQGGLCDPENPAEPSRSSDHLVEIFCNQAAAATLVPREALDFASRPEVSDELLASLAAQFRVSREVVLRRLVDLGYASQALYERKRAEFIAEYARLAQERPRFGPPVYTRAIRNNGRRFTRLVLEAFDRDVLTANDVTEYLGVRLKHLTRIEEASRQWVHA